VIRKVKDLVEINTIDDIDSSKGVSGVRRNQRMPKRGRSVKGPTSRTAMMCMLDHRRSETVMEKTVIEWQRGSKIGKLSTTHPI